jgi:hypothetical protein
MNTNHTSGTDAAQDSSAVKGIKCPCDPAGVDGVTRETCCAFATSATPATADLVEGEREDAYVIERMGKLLAGVAVALKGPEEARKRHGYQDLPEVAEKVMLELEVYRASRDQQPSFDVRAPQEAWQPPREGVDFITHNTEPAGAQGVHPTSVGMMAAKWFTKGRPNISDADAMIGFASDIAQLARQSQGEPIYQVQFLEESGSSAWRDASEDAYHTFMPERRRIVYTTQQPDPASQSQQVQGDAVRDAALEEAAKACMRATPDRAHVRRIGEAAHYVACRDAILTLRATQQEEDKP